MRIDPKAIPGMKVTVMGLGINGGGLASALFFARRGAEVTVTDLRGRDALAASLASLEGLPLRLVLGRHEQGDFEKADLIVKNPAVPPGLMTLFASWIALTLSSTRTSIACETATSNSESLKCRLRASPTW